MLATFALKIKTTHMAKQQRPTPPQRPQNKVKQVVKADKSATTGDWLPLDLLPDWMRRPIVHVLMVAGLAVALYANTLGHQFTQDDAITITDNMFTRQGVSGIPGILSKDTFFGFFKVEGKNNLVSGGRYRPLTLMMFALVHEVAGPTPAQLAENPKALPNPFLFHLLTVLLFAGTCVLLYNVLRKMLRPATGEGFANMMALVTALLFAAHPIHTEAVANIKGCDEIVVLMGSLGTLWLVLHAFDTKQLGWAFGAAGVFFLACMAKENAVTYLAVIPLALWFFRRATVSASIAYSLPIFLGFALFMFIRYQVIGSGLGEPPPELMNNPYLKLVNGQWTSFSVSEKLATITYTLIKYIQLLIAPITLTHDYYPRQIGIMKWSDGMVLLSVLVHIGLIITAVRLTASRSIIAFGIWYYLLTLSIVSNVVFPIGTNMGERFLFMPSVGYCLIISALVLYFVRQKSLTVQTGIIVAGVLALVYGFRTITRNPAWVTNENLFFTDVNSSPNSAKLRYACGGILFDKAQAATDPAERKRLCTEALPHLNKAIEIYPNYSEAIMYRGGANLLLQNYEQSVADYRLAAKIQPEKKDYTRLLANALREYGQFLGEKRNNLAGAFQAFNESWSLNNTDAATARLFGVAYDANKQPQDALQWFKKAVELAPNDASLVFDLGTAYRRVGDIANSEASYARALQLDPQIAQKKAQNR
jgi:protein O-mannosyl-transferase